MSKEKDVYIKDEGEMITICFQTPKAIEALRKQSYEVIESSYGSLDYKKLDIDATQKSLIVAWCMSENLSFETDTVTILN